MGRNGVLGGLSGIDAFGKVSSIFDTDNCPQADMFAFFSSAFLSSMKTMDDVRIRTNIGALITFISFTLIAFLTMGELVEYRRTHEQTTLVVDKSRGEKLTIDLNITFPRVPCYRELVVFSYCS